MRLVDQGDMVSSVATLPYHVNWTHQNGTRIVADFLITPGDGTCPADVELAFDSFCESMATTLLAGWDG